MYCLHVDFVLNVFFSVILKDLKWSLTINKVQVFLVCIVMYNPVCLWLSRAKVEVLTFPPFLIVIVN